MTFVYGMALKQFFFWVTLGGGIKTFCGTSKFSFQEYFKISKTYLPPNNHERWPHIVTMNISFFFLHTMIMKRQDIKKTNLKRNVEHYNYMGRVATPWFGKKKQRSYSHNLAFFHIDPKIFNDLILFWEKALLSILIPQDYIDLQKGTSNRKANSLLLPFHLHMLIFFSFWNMPFCLFVSIYYLATYHHSIWSSRQKWVALNASDSNQNKKKR